MRERKSPLELPVEILTVREAAEMMKAFKETEREMVTPDRWSHLSKASLCLPGVETKMNDSRSGT